ncbi:MAG: FAD-dependent oxidoreductase [Solirubrobacteraceae bacterium]
MSSEQGALTVAQVRPVEPDAGPRVRVLAERCAGCGECIIRCPTGALSLDADRAIAKALDSLCAGCRQCERTCPFAAITVRGPRVVGPMQRCLSAVPADLRLSTREVHEGWRGSHGVRQALLEAERCLLCPDPTCMEGCPAHNDIPGFIRAIREGDLARAHAVLRQTSVLPDICSRVCDTAVQCEGACSWALAGGEPVAIGLLERVITELRPLAALERTGGGGEGLCVCVVGSGPAGIAAAWELLAEGAGVTMLEKDPEPGGVPRWGIPAFVLPDNVGRRPIEALLDAGIALKTNCALGHDVTLTELLELHDAVILAHGAGKAVVPSIEGAGLPGVQDATTFLTAAKASLRRGEPLSDYGAGHQILVLGAGNTAMDVARTIRRLGAEATCVARRDERFARVRPSELEQARREGVEVRFSTIVERLDGDAGGVRAAYLRRTRQRRREQPPKPLRGDSELLRVDGVIYALGYRVEKPPSVEAHQLDRVWVAGDALVGPSTVVGAMAQGRSAARGIIDALGGPPTRDSSR